MCAHMYIYTQYIYMNLCVCTQNAKSTQNALGVSRAPSLPLFSTMASFILGHSCQPKPCLQTTCDSWTWMKLFDKAPASCSLDRHTPCPEAHVHMCT